MNTKRKVICSIFGHEWEQRMLENYRSKSSLANHLKRCLRCGKKEGAYSLKETSSFSFNG